MSLNKKNVALSFEVDDNMIMPTYNKEAKLKANIVETSNAMLFSNQNPNQLHVFTAEELKRIKLESDAKLIEMTRENLKN